jgi:phospholipase C
MAPLMVISPFAKVNYVDHTLTDQTSVLRFVEDNWLSAARVQPGGSFDTIAGPISNMFTFGSSATPLAVKGSSKKLVLDKSGSVVSR